MSFYSVILYLHIIGAAVLFAGLGIEGIVFSNLKKAAASREVLSWGPSMRILRMVYTLSLVLLLVPGLYLAIESWGFSSWVISGLVLLIALSGYGTMTGKKIGMTIGSLIGKEGPLTDEVKKRISDPLLMKSYKIKLTLALGIIFMMTIKPGWTGSLISVAAAFGIGLLLDLPRKQKEEVKGLESA